MPAKTHGMTRSPEYVAYINAMMRCTNKSREDWANYGGRGIEFRFTSFVDFLAVIGKRPSRKHTLDRIENNGHYEVGNIRWATRTQQNRNQRPKRLDGYRSEQYRRKCARRIRRLIAADPIAFRTQSTSRGHLGHRHSPETRQKMRDAWARRRFRA